MKRLLIVDDERHSIDRIAESIDWTTLGISDPMRACSAEEARSALAERGADIMLCDIEMPGENGLELISWARESYPDLETIILTCHADFAYAKEAIRLGSFDYLIKPVATDDLRNVFERLLSRIERSASLKSQSDLGKQWLRNRPLVIERFLLDLIGGTIAADAESISRAADERGLPLLPETTAVPVLLRFLCWKDEPSLKERRIREHEARGRFGDELSAAVGETDIVRMDGSEALAVVRLPPGDAERAKACFSVCERFSAHFAENGKGSVGCYIGNLGPLSALPQTARELRALADDNVCCIGKVFSLRPRCKSSADYSCPDLPAWRLLLEKGASDALRDAAADFLKARELSGKLDANFLALMRQDFLQAVHIVLGNRGVPAHALAAYGEGADGERTVPSTLEWIRSTADAVAALTDKTREAGLDAKTLVEAALRHIGEHISEDLSREAVANRIGLNPDYFGRVFRKETGTTITEYVTKERVAMAVRLLEGTDQPISRIAEQVGYTNFAYFSQTFRKLTGRTPSEYQKRHRAASSPEAR